MNFYAKKTIYYAAIPVLLSLSFQAKSAEKSDWLETNPTPAKVSNDNTWGSWFRDLLPDVPEKPIKTIFEAASDPEFHATMNAEAYTEELKRIKQEVMWCKLRGEGLKEALADLEEFVGTGISPLDHLQQLASLQRARGFSLHWNVLREVQKEFIENVQKQTPEFIKNCFFRDSIEFLQSYPEQTNKNNKRELAKLLNFYAEVQNSFDYLESLEALHRLGTTFQKDFNLENGHLERISTSLVECLYTYDKNTPGLEERLEETRQSRRNAERAHKKQEKRRKAALVFEQAKPLSQKLVEGVSRTMDYAIQHPGQAVGATILGLTSAAAALSTPTLGTQFQISRTFDVGGYSTVGVGGNNIVAVYSNSGGNIIGVTCNTATATCGSEFPISTTSVSGPVSQVTTSTACLSSGNCATTWTSTNIYYAVFTAQGTIIKSQTQANPVVATAQGGSTVTALVSNFLLAYGNSSAGSYANLVLSISANGTPGEPSALDEGPTDLGYPGGTALTNGNGYFYWGGATSLLGVEVSPTGTVVGTSQSINTSPGPFNGGSLAGVAGSKAIVAYVKGNAEILDRSIQGGIPTGNENIIINGTTNAGAPSIASSSDGNTALVAWSGLDTAINNVNVYGAELSSSGALQSNPFIIPSDTNGDSGASVASLANNNFFVSWISGQLYGRSVSFSGGTPTTTTGSPSSSTTGSPSSTTGSPSGTTTGNPTPTPTTSGAVGVSPSLFVSLSVALISGVIDTIYNR